jgi:hypothetical protein
VNRSLLGFPKCRTKGEPCELWPDLVTPVHAIIAAIVWAIGAVVRSRPSSSPHGEVTDESS